MNMRGDIMQTKLDRIQKDIETLAYKCSFKNTRTIGKFKVLDLEDMKKIYRMAK